MRRLNGFTKWLIESVLQQEAIMRFGQKYINKDVNDVPSGFWQWLIEKMEENPKWTPNIEDDSKKSMTRDQVLDLARLRIKGTKYKFVGNVQEPQQEPPVKPQGNQLWALGRIVDSAHDSEQVRRIYPGLPQSGEYVVATKVGDVWTLMTRNGQTTKVKNNDMKLVVQSVKGSDNKPVTNYDPEQLWRLVPNDRGDSEEGEVEVNPTNLLPNAVEVDVPGRLSKDKMNDYNREIEKTFLTTKKNIVISALAGSGKTTALKHLASYKRPGERWLYLVFNKKNQVEATRPDPKTKQRQFPQGVEVLTTHSFLGRVLENNAKLGKVPRTMLHDGRGQSPKMSEILDEDSFKHIATNKFDIPSGRLYNLKLRIKKLASLGKSFNINPRNEKESLALLDKLIGSYDIDTTLMSDAELEKAEKYDREPKDYRDEIVELSYEVLKQMTPQGSKGFHATVRDHDDTLWWAALHADELDFPRYDVVLADEVQDFNKNQQVMLKKLMEAGARIIAVGDKNQAIYRFRGADNDAFDNVESLVHTGSGGASTHTLPINYRSGKKIIDYANEKTHMKDYDENNRLKAGMDHDGEVTENKSYEDAIDIIKDEWDRNKSFSHETAILSRTNAPLLATAMELLRNGIPFQIVGREFLDEIMKFIKAVTGVGMRKTTYPIEVFQDKIGEYVQDKEEAWKGKVKKQDELEEIISIGESLNGVIRYLQEHNWRDPVAGGNSAPIKDSTDFTNFLIKRFGGLDVQESSDDADKYDKMKDKVITITTGHRSKGLEFDRVFIIRNDLYTAPKGDNPEDIQQEKNGQYVAYTRAKKQLHVINSDYP